VNSFFNIISGLWLNGAERRSFENSGDRSDSIFTSHQKRHSKDFKGIIRPPSSPITRSLQAASFGKTSQFASVENMKENKRSSSSKRTRNLSRHNNKVKLNQNKSKLNPNNNKNEKNNNKGHEKHNKNSNKNSILSYRSKKNKEDSKRKSNIGVGRSSPTEEQFNKKSVENENVERGVKRRDKNNYYVGVTKPSSLFVTSSKFNNTAFEKLDDPHKKPNRKDNKKPYSGNGKSYYIGLSKFGKVKLF
jgi:hypothetical protein